MTATQLKYILFAAGGFLGANVIIWLLYGISLWVARG